MAFPKSRILSTQQFVQQILESNRNGERFCFILGSGASVESGIDSGSTLEMRWMNCIMGENDDFETPAMDVATMRQCATDLYEEKQIEHSFQEIEEAWKEAKENGKPISSSYYFDIYKLRFFPNQRNGYRYLERIMEKCEPSIGYHSLSLMLTKDHIGHKGSKKEDNRNNLVITTNFDSLVEDALFIYSDKKPLIVSHESLAGYIESDIQRPIIAKVHRGLMYSPFNSPETTRKLKDEWREALNYAFSTYTPIVIGYGGGDHSLMSFLEEETTRMRHGLYWCYREASGLPEKNIQQLVEKKNGNFVKIGGFDALMLEIGKLLYPKEIIPSRIGSYLQNQCDKRIQQYDKQWKKLDEQPELKHLLEPINETEQQEEEKREKEDTLTAWDYFRRGERACDENLLEEAISEYTKAIEINPNFTIAYINRAFVYNLLELYKKAVEDCSIAIKLDAKDATAYNNRGFAYSSLGQTEKAIEDYTRAIELDPNYVFVYCNRGETYNTLKLYNKAIEDCTKAIELDPNDKIAYNIRGIAYSGLGQTEKAIEDYTKAIKIDSNYKIALENRAKAYRVIGKDSLAEADEKRAAEL